MEYVLKVLSPANIVEAEATVSDEELSDQIQFFLEDYITRYPGYTLEIEAKL